MQAELFSARPRPANALARSETEVLPFPYNNGSSTMRGGSVEKQSIDTQDMLRDALNLLQTALGLLDRAGAPAQIGAHVDLAAHQLAEALAGRVDEPQLISAQGEARH